MILCNVSMNRNGHSITTYTLIYSYTDISGGKANINLHTMLKLTVFMPISCLIQSRRNLFFVEGHDVFICVNVHVIV